MGSVADYLKDMDSSQLAVTASLALATIWGVNKLRGDASAQRRLLAQREKKQTVEVGTAKKGEGCPRRRVGLENGLQATFDPSITTLHELFNSVSAQFPNNNFLGTRKKLGEENYGDYEWTTYGQALKRRDNIASGLSNLANLSVGDFVGLYSINRPDWLLCDLACAHQGLASIALYDTLGQNAVEYIIKHAEIKVVVCAKKQLKTILQALPNCPSLKFIVSVDPLTDDERAIAAKNNVSITTLDEVEADGAKNPVQPRPPKPDNIYTIMYTSGTTGDPKGVILDHSNLIAEVTGGRSIEKDIFTQQDVHMSYLPLAHSFERCVVYTIVSYGAQVGFFTGNINNLFNDIAALRPTFLVGAPRVWSRLYDKLTLTINTSGFVKRTLFNVGFNAKKNAMAKGLDSPLWDGILFSKTKARIGGRVRFILSGSAPLDPKLAEFLKICFCCPVLEGYGLTENFGGAVCTNLKETQLGHVGSPIVCAEVKLIDVPEMDYSSKNTPPTGEIMLRGPILFKGYYKDAEKTREAFDEDGWFHTGDIGRWNPNGTLSIIDRKKNIFKLSQGEYVAVEYLEGVFLRSPFVGQVWVYGSSYKRFLVSVVVPDPDYVAKWAKDNSISGSYEDLCKSEQLKKAIYADLERVGKEAKLQGFEFIKAVTVTSDAFTVDNDLMTPTFKLRRVQLLKYYQKKVDEMYQQIGE